MIPLSAFSKPAARGPIPRLARGGRARGSPLSPISHCPSGLSRIECPMAHLSWIRPRIRADLSSGNPPRTDLEGPKAPFSTFGPFLATHFPDNGIVQPAQPPFRSPLCRDSHRNPRPFEAQIGRIIPQIRAWPADGSFDHLGSGDANIWGRANHQPHTR